MATMRLMIDPARRARLEASRELGSKKVYRKQRVQRKRWGGTKWRLVDAGREPESESLTLAFLPYWVSWNVTVTMNCTAIG